MKPINLRVVTNEECPISAFFDKNIWEVLIDFDSNTVTLIKKETSYPYSTTLPMPATSNPMPLNGTYTGGNANCKSTN